MPKNEVKPTLQQRLKTLLREDLQLARYHEDEDGDIECHYELMPFHIIIEKHDAHFMWMRTFVSWPKDCAETPLDVVDACINEVNYRCKAVRLSRFLAPDRDGDYPVTASISHIVDDPSELSSKTLERYLFLLKNGAREFRELLDQRRTCEEGPRPAPVSEAVKH